MRLIYSPISPLLPYERGIQEQLGKYHEFYLAWPGIPNSPRPPYPYVRCSRTTNGYSSSVGHHQR